MSAQDPCLSAEESSDAAQVAAYLSNHPDFFKAHLSLLDPGFFSSTSDSSLEAILPFLLTIQDAEHLVQPSLELFKGHSDRVHQSVTTKLVSLKALKQRQKDASCSHPPCQSLITLQVLDSSPSAGWPGVCEGGPTATAEALKRLLCVSPKSVEALSLMTLHLGQFPIDFGSPAGYPEYNMESWSPLVPWFQSLFLYRCNP